MNSITQYIPKAPKIHYFRYILKVVRNLSNILEKLIFFAIDRFGIYFDECNISERIQNTMERAMVSTGSIMKLEASNIQQTIKRGIVLYLMLAVVAIPSGICSNQTRLPDFEILIIDEFQSVYPISSVGDEEELEIPAVSSGQALDASEADNQNLPPENEIQPDLPPFHEHIMQAAESYQVDPHLISAIIMAESNYNPNAVSKRGAQGLMQLMPTTARWLGIEDSFDPALNIDGGVRYFRRLLDRFHGDETLALAAYNAGSRYVRKYRGMPPFKATRIYVKKVLKYRAELQNETASIDSHQPAS